ncbi:unnamed protein product [Musa acuminata var. zebrina]
MSSGSHPKISSKSSRLKEHMLTQAFPMHSNHVQQQSHFPPSLFESSSIHNSSLGFSSIPTASSVQDILGFAYCEENAGGSNYSHLGQSMLNHPNWQSWKPKFTKTQPISFDDVALLPSLPAKNCTAGNEVFRVNLINTLFSFGKDSSSSPTNAVPNLEETDLQSQYFVYKSGSVGRSPDISWFSNYDELREELGQMFGIEGLSEDPLRSGWQLVFVDRENDVLLFGDDPWE